MRYVWAVCAVVLVFVWAVAPSRSEGPATDPPPLPTSEPTTEAPIAPNPGDEVVTKDPHTPYGPNDVGGPDSAWTREQLTPEERTVADRGVGAEGWDGINAGYRNAVLQQSSVVTAETAQTQMGIDHVETVGVVP